MSTRDLLAEAWARGYAWHRQRRVAKDIAAGMTPEQAEAAEVQREAEHDAFLAKVRTRLAS